MHSDFPLALFIFMDELWQFEDGCALASVVGSSNQPRKGKSPRKPLGDVTNVSGLNVFKSYSPLPHKGTVPLSVHSRGNKFVTTKKGLVAACKHCVAGSPVSIKLFD
uniref:Uncharacterized protein n=1 Tax=Daucus carota subsp. sativus TaxID=79200 RepID=A0A161WSH6_DAUCS